MERSRLAFSKWFPVFLLVVWLSCGVTAGVCFASSVASGNDKYAVYAWNDLGMHCIDHSYSVFAILPPYNNLHAQVINRKTGRLVTSGITVSYKAAVDTHGSMNSTSIGKTDFWDWALDLFGVQPDENAGLTGNRAPGKTPALMSYDPLMGYWKAEGIPLTPYDDNLNANYYPMVKVVVKDRSGRTLASTSVVLPVSDEITCVHCHASYTGDPMAEPLAGWVNDPDPEKDWKENILLIHDDKNIGNDIYNAALDQMGYDLSGLSNTASGGMPVLCARCHPSNALGTPGAAGVKQLTTSMHSWHATKAMDDNTGMPMDDTTSRSVCYYCHPGSTTQCLRGVMGNAKDAEGNMLIQCQDCHGKMSIVGSADRRGWLDLPTCQGCHYTAADGTYIRNTTVFAAPGVVTDEPSVFTTDGSLYKVRDEHGGVQCEGCHGSTHAEWPTPEPNDNVQSIALQGYAGTLAECSVCHRKVPLTASSGPHGMHTIGQAMVDHHKKYALNAAACARCHGVNFAGTALSKASSQRTFRVKGRSKVTFAKGQQIGCVECHRYPF